ncbi:MAG: hypothetical protein GY906_05500 [bacterium]|nr:hypothetical protein [bacterium]
MVNLRIAREDDREEIPIHFEGVPLKPAIRLAAWPSSLVCAIGGIALMVMRPGWVIEVGAALVAAIGVVLITALVRCRRYEMVVGEKWFFSTLGPFKRHIPLQLVEGAFERPAESWRRLFADRELVLQVPVGTGEDPFPTRDPGELLAALVGGPELGERDG